MKQIEIEQLRHEDPTLYALAIDMERTYRAGPHFRGDDVWTVRARHKITKEQITATVSATNAAEARGAFRTQIKDTAQPYQWEADASAAVPGLGRKFRWETTNAS